MLFGCGRRMSRSSRVRRQFGMNEIMITGSTGVVGRRAVREVIAAGHRVAGVTRSAGGRERLEILAGKTEPIPVCALG
jgi:nucleoside-diphosphate-sugar epimerase